jgi:hypothetical protein
MQPKKFMQEARIRGNLPQMGYQSHTASALGPLIPHTADLTPIESAHDFKQRERHAPLPKTCRKRTHTSNRHLISHCAVPLIER